MHKSRKNSVRKVIHLLGELKLTFTEKLGSKVLDSSGLFKLAETAVEVTTLLCQDSNFTEKFVMGGGLEIIKILINIKKMQTRLQ